MINELCFFSQVFIGVPIVMLMAACYLCVSPFVADALGSLIALAIIAAGLPFYVVFVLCYEKLPLWYRNGVGKLSVKFTLCNNFYVTKRAQ